MSKFTNVACFTEFLCLILHFVFSYVCDYLNRVNQTYSIQYNIILTTPSSSEERPYEEDVVVGKMPDILYKSGKSVVQTGTKAVCERSHVQTHVYNKERVNK